MAYLGRPSEGESPFAIADRAMRDTSSPQPPQQRNPTPRQAYRPQAGSMAAPSPYGSVSDEARRRYEERYARKAAEDQAKREAEARAAQQPPPPPQQQHQQQQHGGYVPPAPPLGQPQQAYGQPPPHHQPQFARPPPRGDSYQQAPPQAPYAQPPPRTSSAQGSNRPVSHSPASPAQAYAQQYQAQHHPASPHQQQYSQQHGYGPPQQPPPPPQQQQGYGQPQQQYQQGPPRHQGVQLTDGPPRQQQQQPPPPPQQQQQQQQQQYQDPRQQDLRQQNRQSTSSQNRESYRRESYQAPPPQAGVDELRDLFAQFDSGRQGQLSYLDLQRLLAKDGTVEAREDCVKMLMNIFDTDRSGSINFMEFEGLYRYIQDWHGIFKRFDQDNSGLIDRRELQAALQGFGFSLPADMVAKLEKRFSPPMKPGERQSAGITFDRFLMACVTVKHYTEAFRRLDPNNVGQATMDYISFVSCADATCVRGGPALTADGHRHGRPILSMQYQYENAVSIPVDDTLSLFPSPQAPIPRAPAVLAVEPSHATIPHVK
ncbi:EF-hand [Cutaneotrichosporon oleaginosum]|uniref:EF-hand n=1 Tax=Cutaneotrichosporon oleaginosum TaxID=879819 RepID=A0A0J0XPH3_9TREE|nr:EF-hand [Cutaneotrichosporon oleaginosum]KLT43011.1 EF-hand [Cutaneotrichosporon oleaginosum]TXT11784.1 hypothetical protein COLE_02194 [Cutaneotrichosporon oleaginosum]